MNANHPVALIEDDDLLDEVLKLAAAAGCEVERVPDAAAARQCWSSSPLLLLDGAGAHDCVAASLPRRDAVVLVATGPPTVDLLESAVSLGAERVVQLPDGESWLVSALADAVESPADTTGKVLAVVGARGGAGASVFAASVGLTVLRDGAKALLVDCDPLGGGLDLVLGAESEAGLRWPDMKLREGRVAASSLHTALPSRTNGSASLCLLSGAREGTGPEPDAIIGVLEAGRRAGETVICDLARDLGDGGRAALARTDLAVIIVPAEVRASVSAKLVAQRLTDHVAAVQLIVRGPSPGGLQAEEVAEAVGLPLLTTMSPEPKLARSLDRGDFQPRPHGPLTTAARTTLRTLATHPTRTHRAAS